MAFRSVEISNPAELHMKNNQLQIEQNERILQIPLEDITQITCIGPDIRISTMALERCDICLTNVPYYLLHFLFFLTF